MALTKVTGQVIKNTTDVTVGVLTVTNTLAVGGTVSIGGTLTYEDVTNVDAVGLITARNGIVVGSGITLSKDGDVFFTGIATGNGSGLTDLNASNLGSGTVPTARLGSGTASSSTFLRGDSTFATVTSTTINNNANNRLITGSGTANTLEAESGLTFDGSSQLKISGSGQQDIILGSTNAGGVYISLDGDSNGDAVGSDYSYIAHDTGGDLIFGADNPNGDAEIIFKAGNNEEKLRIDAYGRVLIGGTSAIIGSSSEFNEIVLTGKTKGAGITLQDVDANVRFQIRTDDDSSGTLGTLLNASTNHDMFFRTNNTERLRITSNGTLYPIGNGQSFNSATLPNGSNVQVNTTSSSHGFSVTRYSGSYGPYGLNIGRSKSDTIGTNSIVADGDDLGHITWYGADGSDFNQAAVISAQVDGAPSDGTDMPGRLIFKTSAEGSGTPTERLRINSVGSAVFANGIQIGVDAGSSSSGGLLIHRYSSTSIDDGTDFDVTITFPHSNTGAFMVECFSGHSHYRGGISYYKVVGMYGASSASTGGVDMTSVQETNTNTLSFSDTSNATQRGNGSDYSVTITGRSGLSNVGTSIDSHVHVYVHSRVTPTSVTIG